MVDRSRKKQLNWWKRF